MRIERCRKVLGVDVGADEMAAVFSRLGLEFERSQDAFVVTPPSFRFDLETEEDLIEEVARLFGYARIPADPPLAPARMQARDEARRSPHDVRRLLATLGYQELVNYSFIDAEIEKDFASDAKAIGVVNPISAQMSVMRTSLLGGLVSVLGYNLNRKASRARLFEIGRVFRRDPAVADGPLSVQGVAQPMCIAGLAYGPAEDEQWSEPSRDVDFFDVKGDVERLFAPVPVTFGVTAHPALHPGRSARISLAGRDIGVIGELHPRLQQKHDLPKGAVLFQLELEPLLARPLPTARELSKFQPLQRDIAVWVDESVTYLQIVTAIDIRSRADDRLSALQEVRLFDVYRPSAAASTREVPANTLLNKEKSLAFRIVLQDTARPLSDTDADAAVAAVVEELTRSCGARLRQ
jgi:phenylalanyl-tRNA synthetase beta chain